MSHSQLADIFVWEDDPGSGDPLVQVAAPAYPRRGLSFLIDDADPVPPALYSPGDERFSYWAAIEGLTRSVSFWAKILTTLKIEQKWQNGSKQIKVGIRSLDDLNSFYSRDRIELGFRKQDDAVIRLCDSPETVAHDLGHAVLDILRPDLWNAAFHEAAAFHESFASVSEVLSTLQLESYRRAIIRETGGYLHHASRLTRSSEQLGDAIRKVTPDAVPSRGVREIFTPFLYEDPLKLFPSSPWQMLSSEPHSFGRIFSGALIQVLSAMFRSSDLSSQSLLAVTVDMGILLAGAAQICELTTDLFSSVARALLEVDKSRYGGRYSESIRAAFVGRGILSISSGKTHPSSRGESTDWLPLESGAWKVQLLEHLRSMDPTLFEKLFRHILKELHFEEVEHKGQTGDGGIDLVCMRRVDFQVDRYYVQCKRYSKKITSPQIRDFKGALRGRGERGIFVTTSSFTDDALFEGKREGVPPLSLIDGQKLCDILQRLNLGVKSKTVTLVSADPASLDVIKAVTSESLRAK
jgi:Restriction endonuclease